MPRPRRPPFPPTKRGRLLLAATRKGDLAAVKKLLDEGANVNARTRYDSTPLFFACDRGHLEIARLLIERGRRREREGQLLQRHRARLGDEQEARGASWRSSSRRASTSPRRSTDSIQEGDAALFSLILEKGKLSQATLDDALLVATVMKNEKNEGMAKQLEDKGAKAIDFAVDEATLKSYEGKFSRRRHEPHLRGQGRETELRHAAGLDALDPVGEGPVQVRPEPARVHLRTRRTGSVSGLRFASRGGDMKLKRAN